MQTRAPTVSQLPSAKYASERIGLGIGLAIAGMFGMAVMDTCAKLLGAGYTVSQIILFRNGIGALAIFVFALSRLSGLNGLRPQMPGLLVLRSALNLMAAFCFFTALRYMPLADAFAIAFAAPLFITALSVPLLGEHVGFRRWSAVIFGFVGVLFIVRPDPGNFRIESLLPLGAALSYALSMLIGRKMTRHMTTSAIMFWPSLVAVVVSASLMPWHWHPPDAADGILFVAMGLIGTLGMSMITQGYRHAPASVIAPFDYTVLFWGAIFGWLIWNDIPGIDVLIGSGILIASGLYILYRESGVYRPVQPPAGPAGPSS